MIVRGGVVARRACDRCGASREALPGVFRVISGRWICNWHSHYISVEKADSVPYRTFSAKPIKDPRPFSIRASHEAAETEILNFLTVHWNYRSVGIADMYGTGSFQNTGPLKTGPSRVTDTDGSHISAAWAGIYAARMLVANDRPPAMLEKAEALLRDCADYLCLSQVHGPVKLNGLTQAIDGANWDGTYNSSSFYPASNVTTWGMYFEGMSQYTLPCAGECLWYAWRRFGTEKYKRCAIAVATALRSLQRCDLNGGAMSFPNVSPRSNMIPWSCTVSNWDKGNYVSTAVYPASLRALVLWKMIKDDIGDIVIGNGYDSNYLTAANDTTISTAAAELIEAWTTAKAGVIGFSTATPYSYYEVPTAIWTSTTIVPFYWALGLSGLYAWSGMTSTVSSIFDWLLSFGSTAFDPDLYDDAALLSNTKGLHSPGTTGLWASTLDTTVMQNGTETLAPYCSGVLADIFAARRPDLVNAIKDILDVRSAFGNRADRNRRIFRGNHVFLGLSYQVYQLSGQASGIRTPAASGMMGQIYRVEPKTPITVNR